MLHWTRAQDDLGVRFTVQPPYSGRVAEPERGNDDARTEQVFKALAKSAYNVGMGVVVTYADHATPEDIRLLYISSSVPQLIGYTMEELMQRSALEFVAPETLPTMIDLQMRRLRGEATPPVFEAIAIHRDGHRVPVEISTIPVEIEGRPANVSFVFDITHRRNAEEALRRS